VGSFGALRLQKHHAVAAGAVALLARRWQVPVELHVSGESHTPGAGNILRAVREILSLTPGAALVEDPWRPAEQFRALIGSMDLCLQLSASETFNIVTADAAACGVPSVVGPAIDWTPADWIAPVDDPLAAADVAIRLLSDPTAGDRGRAALEAHQQAALQQWFGVCR
jgi:glycosyltransferase involved in cell wall biosynthesis